MTQRSEDNATNALRITVKANEGKAATLLDTSSLMYDLNLLFEISRLAVDPRYANFTFSQYTYYRKGRPLLDEDRLVVERLKQESPLEIVTILSVGTPAALTSAWLAVQIFEKVANFKLNRRKLRAEVEKLERELKPAAGHGAVKGIDVAKSEPSALPQGDEELFAHAHQRNAEQALHSVANRLASNRIRITVIDFEAVVVIKPENEKEGKRK